MSQPRLTLNCQVLPIKLLAMNPPSGALVGTAPEMPLSPVVG